MGKITLTMPEKLERKFRKDATDRNISLNRLITQVLTSNSVEILKEVQFLRQELFKLQTETVNLKVNKKGGEL